MLQKEKENSKVDLLLRPNNFDSFIGQEKLKKSLSLMLKAAKQRQEACDHLLFYGPPGLGKTSLAYIVASEMGFKIRTINGPSLKRPGDVAAILTNVLDKEIIFIDEAHRIPPEVGEMFYPALEENKLYLTIGKGPSARIMKFDLPNFTLIASTTRLSFLSLPLRSRFGGVFKVNYYPQKDIEKILERSADILGIKITSQAKKMIAAASRFTPRMANRLLKRSRDYAQVYSEREINENVVKNVFKILSIDKLGLEKVEREIIEVLSKSEKPIGLKTISAVIGEEKETIEEVYEPYLIKLGFIRKCSQGRVITEKGKRYLKTTN